MSVDDRSDDASIKTISHVRLLKSTSAVMRRAARAVSLVALRQQAAPKCNHECFLFSVSLCFGMQAVQVQLIEGYVLLQLERLTTQRCPV